MLGVHQDSLGSPGGLLHSTLSPNGTILSQSYGKVLASHGHALVLFNRDTVERSVEVDFTRDLHLPPGTTTEIRDLWTGVELGSYSGVFHTPVASHGVVMVEVTSRKL